MSKIYLVTGANRGLGLAFIKGIIAAQPEAVVFAGTRNPSSSEALQTLSKEQSRVRVVEFDVTKEESAKAAVAIIEKEVGKLDIVIANAGVNSDHADLLKLPLTQWRQNWDVNTYGVINTFLAASDLLLESKEPQFVVISSIVAGLTNHLSFKNAPYASAKAAANMIVRSLDAEIPTLTTYSIHPGWVDTDLGRKSGEQVGGTPPTSDVESVQLILSIVTKATRKEYGGKFLDATAEGGPAIIPY